MCFEKYNTMSVGMNDCNLVSNERGTRAPIVGTSIIAFVQSQLNKRPTSFHAEEKSVLHSESLQGVFDNPSPIHLLNRRHSQSRRGLRAKVNKKPTTDFLKCPITWLHLSIVQLGLRGTLNSKCLLLRFFIDESLHFG